MITIGEADDDKPLGHTGNLRVTYIVFNYEQMQPSVFQSMSWPGVRSGEQIL